MAATAHNPYVVDDPCVVVALPSSPRRMRVTMIHDAETDVLHYGHLPACSFLHGDGDGNGGWGGDDEPEATLLAPPVCTFPPAGGREERSILRSATGYYHIPLGSTQPIWIPHQTPAGACAAAPPSPSFLRA